MTLFNWKENCKLCIPLSGMKMHYVTTFPMHDKLLECCDKEGDVWASEVFKSIGFKCCASGLYQRLMLNSIHLQNCIFRIAGVLQCLHNQKVKADIA